LSAGRKVRFGWKTDMAAVDLGDVGIHDAQMAKPSVLPVDLEKQLSSIGQRLENGESVAAELPAVTEGISALPAISISQAAPAIAYTAKLFRWRPGPSLFKALHLERPRGLARPAHQLTCRNFPTICIAA